MSQKVIDLKKHKNKKDGNITPEEIVSRLSDDLSKGKIKEIIYVTIDDEDLIWHGSTTMSRLKAIGLLEVTKMQITNDM